MPTTLSLILWEVGQFQLLETLGTTTVMKICVGKELEALSLHFYTY